MANEVMENKNEVATQAKSEKLVSDFSLGIYGSSDNFSLALNMAQKLSMSDMIPATYQGKPANCLIALEQAQRLNVSPMMVMQNMYVIHGRPSWSSKFLIAMINGSGKFDEELQFDETKDKDGNPYSCTAWTTRKGKRVEGMVVTMDMAKAEGWLGKNGSKWKTMPQLMLRYRAASFFASLNCPEITLGIYTREEVLDSDMPDLMVDSEMVEQRVQAEIEENANTQELLIEDENTADGQEVVVDAKEVPAEQAPFV